MMKIYLIPFLVKLPVVLLLLLSTGSCLSDTDTDRQIVYEGTFPGGPSFSSSFGNRKKIILPDQTEVTLNSGTTLWLDKKFGKQNRIVRIAGDALFNVKKKGKPFVIHTPHLIITTTSAVARVNAYAGSAGEETLLLSGKLHVVKAYYSKLDHEPYDLKDGEMVMMNKDIDLMEKETFDPVELRTWMEDRLVFKDISLNELVNTLKNWFNTDITVSGNVPSTLRYTGNFTRASLQDILAAIGKNWKFTYRTHQNQVDLKF